MPRRRAAGAGDRRRARSACRPNCAARTLDRRHHADRRDLAADRTADRVRARSSARARSGSTPKAGRSTSCCALTEEAITLRRRRRADGDVRHRGHDARRSRHAASAVPTAIRAGATARVHRRHRRPRDAGRRRGGRCGSSRSVVEECGGGVGIDWHGHRDRDLAVDQHDRRDRRGRRRGCTAPRSASASASATRRWTRCS